MTLGDPFASETVVRLRGVVTEDRYGNEVVDWDNPNELSIVTLAPAEPRPSQEPVQDARNSVVSGWTLYLPSGADVTRADKVRVRGEEYPVQGELADWLGAGVVVQAYRTEG